MLNTYQLRQSNHLKNHIENELQELKKKVALRKALLEERVWTVFVLYLVWLRVVSVQMEGFEMSSALSSKPIGMCKRGRNISSKCTS